MKIKMMHAFKSLMAVTVGIGVLVSACKKDPKEPFDPNKYKPESGIDLVLSFHFDETQPRLDNFGQPAVIPAGHAAQTPVFHTMGAHYIELSEANDIPAYNGTQLYESPMTTEGGEAAIDFDQARYAANNEEFFRLDLSHIEPGTYQYLRISLSYQEYDVAVRASGFDFQGRLASFVGANTFIRSYDLAGETITVNENKKQGYWAFNPDLAGAETSQGQAPEGATTVPNPIAATSAIPPGSCLVTGVFDPPLVITGNETSDIEIEVSVSINNSFEWVDGNDNGIWEPLDGENVVDMGVRGLIPRPK